MDDDGSSLAAPTIFILVALLQFIPRYLEHQIKSGGAPSDEEKELRAEIKQLLKEASTLSQPSTFAQAAKLRRTAAAKEKELTKCQEQQILDRKSLYNPYMKYVTPVKALTYLLLGVWFWKYPVASISKELVQPFGRMLSWKSGGGSEDKVMVGIVPWLILCSRVSKLICRKIM
ncbi:tail-anchored protein insertion receptor WRB-like [Chenopodium quinoa]|uniref:tail-anchored protein insertion receptor WRB-like n=1 Tax=Chenopodium quinoa TaxID=63459 RepID=UPI000B780FD1|nr:tail-anchored protein insertion receptor WRB-like [Chenopodium quinoa]XP_021726735.1 tail-anchored protein insertion receptor WRB-like [Chenopodium quinoa]